MKRNNNQILARNILIHNELEKISEECEKNGIKLILLKGAALIELFPEYSFEREMEDVDVLIEEKNFLKFLNILRSLGYEYYSEDPNVMYKNEIGLKIDITTKLWYLTKKENQKLINSCFRKGNFYFLPPNQMFKHIFLHSQLIHSNTEEKWLKDIKLLSKRMNMDFEYIKISNIFLNRNYHYYGHILQLYYLPWRQKIMFVIDRIFPSFEFMIRRYKIKRKVLIPFYYFFRLADLSIKTFLFLSRLINFHK